MKIAVMGAGALGGYYGARLIEAGADVAFIARGAHLDALKRDGLRIESPLGDAHLTGITASDDPAALGRVDVVLFLVKLYDTRQAAEAIKPLLGPDTCVLSLQNGIDGWREIGAIIGPQRVIGGTTAIPAEIAAPGVIRHNGAFARITIGEFSGETTHRVQSLLNLLQGAKIDAGLSSNINVTIWQKLITLSALSAITALTRLPMGPIRAHPQTRDLFFGALRETHAVGLKACPGLTAEHLEKAEYFANTMPDTMQASMLYDLQHGKRLELNHLSGAVVRTGAQVGVATPIHSFVQAALQPYANGHPEMP